MNTNPPVTAPSSHKDMALEEPAIIMWAKRKIGRFHLMRSRLFIDRLHDQFTSRFHLKLDRLDLLGPPIIAVAKERHLFQKEGRVNGVPLGAGDVLWQQRNIIKSKEAFQQFREGVRCSINKVRWVQNLTGKSIPMEERHRAFLLNCVDKEGRLEIDFIPIKRGRVGVYNEE
tara:strand:+ start:125 stop:640 length:516 start_codon:yes stop_codon:yes gene_type:complete